MHIIALLVALLIATPVSAQSLCYYWVDADGTITSYQLPPFDIATPNPLAADDGSRLVIAPARRCRDNTVLNAPPPQAAVTPFPMQPPATLGEPLESLPAPEPTPDFQPVPEAGPDFQLEPLEAAPEPPTEPLAEPVPTPELQLEPTTDPGVQPVPESEPQPAPESEPQPVPTPELRLEPGELSTTSVTRAPPTTLHAFDGTGG
jgi:hypothetical protein